MKSLQTSGRRQAASFKSFAVAADALGVSIYATACARHHRAGALVNTRRQRGGLWATPKKNSAGLEFRWR